MRRRNPIPGVATAAILAGMFLIGAVSTADASVTRRAPAPDARGIRTAGVQLRSTLLSDDPVQLRQVKKSKAERKAKRQAKRQARKEKRAARKAKRSQQQQQSAQ